MDSDLERRFPLLGSTGSDSAYRLPSVPTSETPIAITEVATMKSEVPIQRLRRERVPVDQQPLAVLVLGRVDRYGGSPCKSGVFQGSDVYFVSKSLPPGQGDYVRSLPLDAFVDLYETLRTFPVPMEGTISGFSPEFLS